MNEFMRKELTVADRVLAMADRLHAYIDEFDKKMSENGGMRSRTID